MYIGISLPIGAKNTDYERQYSYIIGLLWKKTKYERQIYSQTWIFGNLWTLTMY